MLIQTPSSFVPAEVGSKAWNLKVLQDMHYPVPHFVAIPTTTVTHLLQNDADLPRITAEVLDALGSESALIVRSSALDEDGSNSAQAGQFYTTDSVTPSDLGTALTDSLQHPSNQAAAANGRLALIIQQYLPPQRQGVMFSRHPYGKQTMMVEHSEIGSVVAGEKADQLEFHPHDPPTSSSLPHLPLLSRIGRELEEHFAWPQDIEWLEHENQLYVLQTRHITSIDHATWHGICQAEEALSDHSTPYLFRQNTLTEQFPHPRPLAVSLLRSLYQVDGPVAQTYRHVGLNYQPQTLHTVIAGSLYIDQEAELRTIFPSLSMLSRRFGKPQWSDWRGSTTTLRNLVASTLLRTNDTHTLLHRLKQALHDPLPHTADPSDRWRAFLAVYPLVYEVSLRTQKALTLLPKHTSIPPGPIDHTPLDPADYGLSQKDTRGNSLSLDDMSPFTYHIPDRTTTSSASSSAQEVLRTRARTYLTLREYSRWLTVKHLHLLRQDLTRYGEQHLPTNPGLIHYATWDEITTDTLDVPTLEDRAATHKATQWLKPPATLTSRTLSGQKKVAAKGLAPGCAHGQVRSIETIEPDTKTSQILYVTVLTPALTRHFPYITGIITASGGILSHLAIMAREHGLPVIRSEIPYAKLRHKVVEIDGDTGTLNTKE